MAKRTYIATIDIEKPDGEGFHQPWVYEHAIECAVQDISGHNVDVTVVQADAPVSFWQRCLAVIRG